MRKVSMCSNAGASPKQTSLKLNQRNSALLHVHGSCKQQTSVLAFHKSDNLSLLWFIPPQKIKTASRVWTGCSDNRRCQTRKMDSVERVRTQPVNVTSNVVALFLILRNRSWWLLFFKIKMHWRLSFMSNFSPWTETAIVHRMLPVLQSWWLRAAECWEHPLHARAHITKLQPTSTKGSSDAAMQRSVFASCLIKI